MSDRTPAVDPRAARRRARRRRARRRRAVALLVMIGAVAGAVAIARSVGEDGAPASAGAARTTATASGTETAAAPTDTAAQLGSGRPVTLAFGGDVHFESPIRERLASNPASLLAGVAPILAPADIAMVNIETAITDGGTPAAKNFVFRAPASALGAMTAGGIDVATMANNHGMDYGVTGLRDSLRAGRAAGLPLVGIGLDEDRAYAPFRATVNGQRVAIIGATQVLDDQLIADWTAGVGTPGLASAKRVDRLVAEVEKARATSDTVAVYLHWGVELSSCPTDIQKQLAGRLVAAGADIVVGGHAHVLAGGGRMGTAVVNYGLGNFVFYASREATVQSGVFEVTVTGRRVDSYRWRPARISGGLPRALAGAERALAVDRWNGLRSCTGLVR